MAAWMRFVQPPACSRSAAVSPNAASMLYIINLCACGVTSPLRETFPSFIRIRSLLRVHAFEKRLKRRFEVRFVVDDQDIAAEKSGVKGLRLDTLRRSR